MSHLGQYWIPFDKEYLDECDNKDYQWQTYRFILPEHFSSIYYEKFSTTCMSCSGDKETQKKKYYQKPPKQNKTAPKTNNNKILQKPGENKKIKKGRNCPDRAVF